MKPFGEHVEIAGVCLGMIAVGAFYFLRSAVVILLYLTGVIPFISLQLVGLVLVYCFPQIALWLPKVIGW